MTTLNLRRCTWLVFVTVLSLFVFSGCQHCNDDYEVCVSQVSPEVLATFSYEYTCMYPTMTIGDARVYCECQDEYKACTED